MPSFRKDINLQKQFIIAIKVLPSAQKVEAYKTAASYRALIDTGANRCGISNKIVTDLKLRSHHKMEITTAGGPHETLVYLVGIAVPVTQFETQHGTKEDGSVTTRQAVHESWHGLQQVEVTTFPDVGVDRGFDIILGMDLLMPFHITIHDGNIIVSV